MDNTNKTHPVYETDPSKKISLLELLSVVRKLQPFFENLEDYMTGPYEEDYQKLCNIMGWKRRSKCE